MFEQMLIHIFVGINVYQSVIYLPEFTLLTPHIQTHVHTHTHTHTHTQTETESERHIDRLTDPGLIHSFFSLDAYQNTN